MATKEETKTTATKDDSATPQATAGTNPEVRITVPATEPTETEKKSPAEAGLTPAEWNEKVVEEGEARRADLKDAISTTGEGTSASGVVKADLSKD